MQLRTAFLLLLLIALTIFAMLNWSAFMAPTALSLGFTTIEAPLGLVLLGTIAVLTTVFLAFVVYLQTTVLVEFRRNSRELQSQRDLADKAEASRFTELQNFVGARLAGQETQMAAIRTEILARIDAGNREMQTALEREANGVAAHIAELDDRIERAGHAVPPAAGRS